MDMQTTRPGSGYWNIAEALSWVMYRGEDALGIVSQAVQEQWSQGLPGEGRRLLDFPIMDGGQPPTPHALGVVRYLTCEEAESRLFAACRSGKIAAKGIAAGSGAVEDIPPEEWAGRQGSWHGGLDGPYVLTRGNPNKESLASAWRSLQFPQEQVRALWPIVTTTVFSVTPLRSISDENLEFYVGCPHWTLEEALHILSGSEPILQADFRPDDHFSTIYRLAIRAVQIGKIGQIVIEAGARRIIDSPERWLEWIKQYPKYLTVDTRVIDAMESAPPEVSPAACLVEAPKANPSEGAQCEPAKPEESETPTPLLNKAEVDARLTEYFDKARQGGNKASIDNHWHSIKAIPGMENIKRERVRIFAKEHASDTLSERGRPPRDNCAGK